MRVALVFILVFFSALLAGALAAYPVYVLIGDPATLPFHKIISRATSIAGLIFSLLYIRYCGILNYKGLGLVGPAIIAKRNFLVSYIAGVIILLCLVGILLSLNIYEFDAGLNTQLSNILLLLAKAVITGLLVGFVEELMFRGALFGGLRSQSRTWIAVSVTSLIYAGVHFIKYRAVPDDIAIGWLTGIQIFPAALFRLSNPVTIDSFLTLFILGFFLAYIRIKTGSLFACIGLHAGIVATLKFCNYLTNYVGGTKYDFVVNKYDHQFGILASTILLISILLLRYVVKVKHDTNSHI